MNKKDFKDYIAIEFAINTANILYTIIDFIDKNKGEYNPHFMQIIRTSTHKIVISVDSSGKNILAKKRGFFEWWENVDFVGDVLPSKMLDYIFDKEYDKNKKGKIISKLLKLKPFW